MTIIGLFLAFILPIALPFLVPFTSWLVLKRKYNNHMAMVSFWPLVFNLYMIMVVGNILWSLLINNNIYFAGYGYPPLYSFIYHDSPEWAGIKGAPNYFAPGWSDSSLNVLWLALTIILYVLQTNGIILYYKRKKTKGNYMKFVTVAMIAMSIFTALFFCFMQIV